MKLYIFEIKQFSSDEWWVFLDLRWFHLIGNCSTVRGKGWRRRRAGFGIRHDQRRGSG
jgi:hypothetical protein